MPSEQRVDVRILSFAGDPVGYRLSRFLVLAYIYRRINEYLGTLARRRCILSFPHKTAYDTATWQNYCLIASTNGLHSDSEPNPDGSLPHMLLACIPTMLCSQ